MHTWKYTDTNEVEKIGYVISDDHYIYGTDENLKKLWKNPTYYSEIVSVTDSNDGGVYAFVKNSGDLNAFGENTFYDK